MPLEAQSAGKLEGQRSADTKSLQDQSHAYGVTTLNRMLIALLLLLVLLASGLLVASAPSKALSPAISPGVTIQQTSVAMNSKNVKDLFYQNGSGLGQSHPITVPVNLTGYTSIQGFTFQLTASALSNTPQIVANQSTKNFFNASLTAQALFSPTPGNNPVTITTYALYNATGVYPPVGTYPVFDNMTQAIQFTDSTPSGWALSGISFSISDNVTASYGYFFNTTSIFFPFPQGVSVNYSSVHVTAGRYQVTYGGVYVLNNSLRSGTSFATTVSFQPVPIDSGPAVFIPLTKARLVGGTFSTYTSFGNFTDNLGLPYFGLYVLEVSFSNYTLNPASVTILENGKAASKATYSVNPASITILPNNLLIGVGQNVAIQANFTSLQVPPTASLTPTTVLITLNGFPVTLGIILEFSLAALAVYAALVYEIYYKRGTGSPAQRRRKVRAVITDITFISISVVAFWIVSTLI